MPERIPHTSYEITTADEVTVIPVFDPSVRISISNETGQLLDFAPGKGVDYIRFSEDNQQYIVNWDTSGFAPGEYSLKASFGNGYMSETKILLR